MSTNTSIMAALSQFEAAEANLDKLDRLWTELSTMIPSNISFGGNLEYEDKSRAFGLLLASLPKVRGWKPSALPPDLDEVAQLRFDAMEVDEPSVRVSVERWIEEPGRELRDYRFRFNNERKALIREALVKLIDQIDADLRTIRTLVSDDADRALELEPAVWGSMREHVKQIEVLLGSSVARPARWSDLLRHLHFGCVADLVDIETRDWPDVKNTLRRNLYGEDEAIPVQVDDLSSLVDARPTGPIATALSWSCLDDEAFERLIFALISNAPSYENPEWLMQTRAPDRGRDLSVTRVMKDPLSGTRWQRIVIQCKHWTSRSVNLPEVVATSGQMALWTSPKVDVLIIATSGRFTADAVTWIEQHNGAGAAPHIEMWPDSHLELLLAERPAIIAEFGLRAG